MHGYFLCHLILSCFCVFLRHSRFFCVLIAHACEIKNPRRGTEKLEERPITIFFLWVKVLSEEHFKWMLEFKERVEKWDKNRAKPFEDKKEAACRFAIEVLDADPAKAAAFINRTDIQWNVIKHYARFYGEKVACKVCGNENDGGYWCKPCIHNGFCCECCILMGIPYYECGVFAVGTQKCQYCGAEFMNAPGLGSTTNLGAGVTLSKTDIKKVICPKCGKTT